MDANQIFEQFKRDQESGEIKKRKDFIDILGRINFSGILVLVLAILVCVVLVILVNDLSVFISDFIWTIKGWAKGAKNFLENKAALTMFTKLVLTTVAVGGVLYLIKKK